MATIAQTLTQAKQLQEAGHLSQAEQLYRQVLQADPASGEAFFLLGNTLFCQGKLQEAADHYQHAIQLCPDLGGAYLNLSEVLRRLGNLQGAADCLRRCLRRLPQSADAHYNLANTLAGLGRLEEAVTHYQEALRLRPDFAEAHNNLASTFLSLDRADDAVVHLETAIRLRPNYVDAHCNLGHAYRKRNQLTEAIRSYQLALEFNPDYGPAHKSLGQVFMDQGDKENAEFHLRKASLVRAQQLEQIGDLLRAEQLYRQVLQADPANGEGYFLLGNNLFRQGKLPEAAEQFKQSIQLCPDSGGGYLNLADVLQRQGNLEAAADCLRDCLLRLPEFSEAHYNLGIALRALWRLDDAVAHYQEAIRLRPDFAEAHRNLANTFLGQGKVDEAARLLEQAVRLRPTYAEAHCGLGNAYRARSQFYEAIASYQRAIELKPAYGPAHNGLGEAFLELGDKQQAELHFRRALHNNPAVIRTLLNLASHGFYKAIDPSIEKLKSWLTDPRLPEDMASQLHIVLGTLLDRAGVADDAFAHFRRANLLRHSIFQKNGIAFDSAEHSRRIDRLIATFSADYFRRVHGFGIDTELPVFIVGMPRSGTTLVEQILSQHPKVFGAGELTYLDELVAALPRRLGAAEEYPECLSRLDSAAAQDIAAAHLRKLTNLAGDAERVSDKMPLNFLNLGIIATLFPRAQVLWCRRDPRDTCLSCYFQFFYRFPVNADLADLGRYYRVYERLMAHWQAVLPLPMLEVVYEDLVANQEAVSRRLVEFCHLPWDEQCLKFHENRRPVKTASVSQVRQPMYTSSVGRWRRYAAHLESLFLVLGNSAPAEPEV